MKKIIIEGGNKLTGTIKISGAKNSVLAIIPATILSDEGATIYNVPRISDTNSLIDILELLNGKVTFTDETITLDNSEMENKLIPQEYSSKLRASYYFMGALLGKFKRCEICLPGGCNIGARPIDFHLKAFEQMGAKIETDCNKHILTAEKLKGANIFLDFASVGATVNIMLAAVKAEGITTINNAAKEPEIVNIATFLNNMGAKITGAGTSVIKIVGVDYLGKAIIDIIPDRIEAGTYLIAGALLGRDLKIEGVIKEHLEAVDSKLREIGASLEVSENSIIVNVAEKLKPVNVKTLVYPGFPTDLGQPMTTLLTQCEGTSIFEETIYENRFGNVAFLNKMGANIIIKDKNLILAGNKKLKGNIVRATDLRAGASLIIAGLIAEGETVVEEAEHILRGYENIVEKLRDVGAKIKIEE